MNRNVCFRMLIGGIAAAVLLSGNRAQAQGENNKGPTEIGMLLEYIELDHREANRLIREYASRANDVGELRKMLADRIEKKKAVLVETAWLRARSGQRAKTESIRETIYPTEFDPPEIPNTLGGIRTADAKKGTTQVVMPQAPPGDDAAEAAPAEILMTSATPTAFETRNLGLTFEVDPVLSDDEEIVYVNSAPEIFSKEGDLFYHRPDSKNIPWGVDHISMPLFHAMKTGLQLKAVPGKYNLLGMHTPPGKPDRKLFVFLRVDLLQAK